jgi:PPOX class probable F420-dependent enzyme
MSWRYRSTQTGGFGVCFDLGSHGLVRPPLHCRSHGGENRWGGRLEARWARLLADSPWLDAVRLTTEEARRRFTHSRVARLATVYADGRPHIVPIVFAVHGQVLFTAVDAKPKSTQTLQRLANIATHPQVALLADHYDEEWTQLWWARADGLARLTSGAEAGAALGMLAARYQLYQGQPPPGPVLAVDITRWSGWSAARHRSTDQLT